MLDISKNDEKEIKDFNSDPAQAQNTQIMQTSYDSENKSISIKLKEFENCVLGSKLNQQYSKE